MIYTYICVYIYIEREKHDTYAYVEESTIFKHYFSNLITSTSGTVDLTSAKHVVYAPKSVIFKIFRI